MDYVIINQVPSTEPNSHTKIMGENKRQSNKTQIINLNKQGFNENL